MRSIKFQASQNDIVVRLREWEGIGNADYTTLTTMSIIEAEQAVQNLQVCIEQAKMNKIDSDNRRIEHLRKEIEERQRELHSLEGKRTKTELPSPTLTPPTGGSSASKT